MKQVAQNYKSGELVVLDVPRPQAARGGVLVRSLYSLISTGTELMKVDEAQKSLVGKARARPDQVRKVLDSVAQQGMLNTYKKVMNRLDSYTPLGYSLCGVVTDIGEGAEEFSVGQVVAAAGNEFALHAEYNWVPVNLCVPVPDGVAPEFAAFSTVGAIAMHGVRRSEVQLGETACVVGLGLVGQLVVRLLVAAGVRTYGLDPVDERCRLAEKAGAIMCAAPDDAGADEIERALRDGGRGLGADHVFLAAGGSSNGPVELAARLARDRARVVDIGKTRLDLPWNAYYDKELDVRFSRSYGPGRYDPTYEVGGIDYPAGYVRWTERRNLECFVDLIARQQIDLSSLISEIFPITDATDVYQRLHDGEIPGVGFLFRYPDEIQDGREAPASSSAMRSPSTNVPEGEPRKRSRPTGKVRIGFVGAGNYASSMLLPYLAGNEKDVSLAHVATNTALSAANAKRRFGFETISTNADDVIDDDSIDAVFIVTRHSSHAELTCRALAAGKTVFVEKPLALSEAEVERIRDVVLETGNDRLMVGFNRRFAPLFNDLRRRFGGVAAEGSVARYLVNAGQLDAGSWYLDSDQEGSRFVGEGGHFIDTVSWWLDSHPTEAYAVSGPGGGDVDVSLRYENGSLATVTYLTSGSAGVPKEIFDASGGGRSARLENFRNATVWADRRPARLKARQDKGQHAQLDQFVAAVRNASAMPITLESLLATTRATIAVQRSLASGQPEAVSGAPPARGIGGEAG